MGCIIEGDDGSSYNGTVNKSVGGHECLSWDTPSGEDSESLLYETLGLTEEDDINQVNWAHNYCRNLGGDPAPSCFIDATEIDYCDIPNCMDRKVMPKSYEIVIKMVSSSEYGVLKNL